MRLSDFSLRNLRTFCTVVEHQGFSGAQSVLGMSQPAISTHIKDLEETLGFRVCNRGRSGFMLTPKGQVVYDKAKQILGSLETFGSELGELRQVLSGTLRVGLVDSMITNPQMPLHAVFEHYCGRSSEVEISLKVSPPDVLERNLLNNTIQLAIGPFHNFVTTLSYEQIYSERHSLYCGPGHPLFEKKTGDIKLPDIMSASHVMRSYLGVEELKKFGEVKTRATVSNMEASALLIRSGRYIGYIPDHYAAQWVKRGELRALDHLGLEWISPFYLVTRRSPALPRFARIFIEDLHMIRGRPGQ